MFFKTAFLAKLVEIFDPILNPIRALFRRVYMWFRNRRLRANHYKFRTVRPNIVPEYPVVQGTLIIPSSVTT